MRRSRLALALAAATLTLAAAPQAAEPVRLVVIVVVDQMRADYLTRFERHWRGGFRMLLDSGLVFERTRYPYLNTVTCAGHATIGTGTLPRTHGMITNGWWHRDVRRTIPCTEDDKAAAISYGREVKGGEGPLRLRVPTLADELREQRSGARVVALSLKPRSAIGLAGHGGDAVVWYDEVAGSFATSRAYATGPVPAVKAFIDAHPYEQDHGKVWQLSAPAASYLHADAGVGERPPTGWSGLFPHPVEGRLTDKGRSVDAQFYNQWQASPFSDQYLAAMANDLTERFELGRRNGAVDFLGVSFSALDLVGHPFGPESREVEDVLRHLDATLGTLIARLDALVGRERYVLALSADHGVADKAGTSERGGRIATEDVRERIEATLVTELGPLQKGSYVDAVSFTYVYFAQGVMDRLRATPKAMAAVERAVRAIPGISHVFSADTLSDTSRDPIVVASALSHVNGESGDLIVVPKPNWYFQPRNVGTATTHGTPHAYDTDVPFILFGGGLKPGRVSAAATPADIAPTLARLAGVKMPRAEGRVRPEAVR